MFDPYVRMVLLVCGEAMSTTDTKWIIPQNKELYDLAVDIMHDLDGEMCSRMMRAMDEFANFVGLDRVPVGREREAESLTPLSDVESAVSSGRATVTYTRSAVPKKTQCIVHDYRNEYGDKGRILGCNQLSVCQSKSKVTLVHR